MNADGSSQANVTNGIAADSQPSWSPDGTKIAFASERDHAGRSSIYVMNANGSNQTRLTFTSDPFSEGHAVWSRDGSKLAFVSTRDSIIETWQETDAYGNILNRSAVRTNKELYVMNADGSIQLRLTNTLENDDAPYWSPDGTKIIFRSDRERDCCDPTPQLWTMNADGSNPALLTSNAYSDYSPSWTITGNQSPVANAGGPYSAMISQTVQFNGSGSFDPDGSITSYSWNFGDNTSGSGVSPTHAYTSAGTYTVTLTVTDNLGSQASATTSATITSNQPPVASAGGPYSGMTGQTVQFNGGGSFDPDGSITSYAWNFGDNASGSGVSPTHSYASAGTYTVNLTVTDNLGSQAGATTTATIGTNGIEQYAANFSQWALLRQPYSDESLYWNDIFRSAYQNGQGSLVLATREFGRTVFESSEYAARSRSDRDYVYDLYKTYLMREPDQGGWDNWTAAVPSYGREHVRRGFDESSEFLNLMATRTANGIITSAVSSLSSARVDPKNQPGNGLLARDAEWSLPLLSVPGRSGLDLGLSLSYSSQVWTRSGPYLYFNEDNSSPSPGFRLGFPTIQEKFFDAQVGKNVYVMTMSSGHRVELRQVGASNVYEAGDSSYLQLIDNGSLLARSTDGTQLTYGWFNHEFRCNQIKDRNGNYLTINYNWLGDITTITDTLGRIITFNYDTNANPISITQSWTVNGVPQTHVWATFGWGTHTMASGFSSVSVVGAPNGSTLPVLTQVGLHDGSRYNFEYTGAGQVNVIRRFTFDNVQRAYTAYVYDTPANVCPRLSATRVWAENWTGINGVPNEVVTQYSELGDGSHQVIAPDGTVYKEFYAGSAGFQPADGWAIGLIAQTEVWSGGVRQKWTTLNWTQDNTAVNYQTNPRMTESNIYDAGGNRRRTTIDYSPPAYAQYGLPYFVSEYAADGLTEIRRSYTDYNLSQAYLDRRIIGLVSARQIYDPVNAQWQNKTTYGYDDPARLQALPAAATQHDGSYSTAFTTRGNVTSVSGWDVTDITNASKALTTQMTCNAAGGVLSSSDPMGHQSSISYADSFSDGNNGRNTFAYPTTITDGDNFSSYLQYNFDFGARTRIQGPPPANQSQGLIQNFVYDAAARLDRITTANNGAYNRFVYGPDYVQSFATVNTVADEAYAFQVFDGVGRIRAAGSNHPGSVGGYRAQESIYDLMGRAVKQSNPTEITGAWLPAGDDAGGWVDTQQTYDWQGRPRVTTNTDLTTKEANYSGCGCAGGEVVTLTDEGTIDAGVFKRRQQKIYSDVLGRTVKTELLNWQGGSVYSSTVNTYNARDQVTQVRQYAGAEGSATYQDTVTTYDGYGRLKTKHAPEQSAGTATIWDYNSDDTVQKVTDARGASETFTYNARHLVTSKAYAVPGGSTIPVPASVGYAYDAAGNRTSMTDGLGSMSYQYDSLSRITSETRVLTGVGTYALSYGYNLAGGLTSITDPFGAQVGYVHDSVGRVTSVTGSNFGGVSSYASDFHYRASGAVKDLDYGNGGSLSVTYNARLKPASFTIPGVMSKTYDYYSDGRLKFSHDLLNPVYDRSFAHDHAARITEALSGAEARNEGTTSNRPYKQTFAYDAFSHMTQRPVNQIWTEEGEGFSPAQHSYVNERNTAWSYDADGNLTDSGAVDYTFDAAGQTSRFVSYTPIEPEPGQPIEEYGITLDVTQSFDGNGMAVKKIAVNTVHGGQGGDQTTTHTTYLLRSSVLGGKVVSEIGSESEQRGFVYLGDEVLAVQNRPTQSVMWEYRDPGSASVRMTTSNGTVGSEGNAELDPLGGDAGLSAPPAPSPAQYWKITVFPGFGNSNNNLTCVMDGMPTSCSEVGRAMNAGAANQCPENICGPRTVTNGTEERFLPLTRDPDTDELGYGVWRSNLPGGPDTDDTIRIGSRYWDPVRGLNPNAPLFGFESIEPQNTEVTTVDPDGIRGALDRMLRIGDCGKFVEDLINQLGASTKNPFVSDYALDLFDAVAGGKGGFIRGGLANKNRVGATVSGNIRSGNAAIHLTSHFNGPPVGNSVNFIDAFQTLHELVHLAGRNRYYDDQEVAQTLSDMTGIPGLPERKNYKSREAFVGANSAYFSKVLSNKCPVLSR